MTSTSTQNASGTTRKRYDFHTIMLGLGATFLTGAVLWFNGSYGMTFSYGMAAAFIGFAIVKDAGFAYAWSTRNRGGRVASGLLSLIAFGICCLAAVGAASHGRQEATDPKAAQISAYDTAEKQRAAADARLNQIGKVATAADAEAKASGALAAVDPAIARRTKGCVELAPESNGPRQVSANRQACQPYIAAKAAVEAAKEAAELRAKIDAADAVLAKGRPATADAQASTLATLFGLFFAFKGIEGIQAWTNLFIGLGLEIGSPLAWAAFAAAVRSSTPAKAQNTVVAARETISDPVSVAPVSANDTTGQSDFGGISEFEMAKVVRLFANDVEPDGNGGPNGGNVIRPKRFTREEVRADLTARIERGEAWPSQRALAAQFGLKPSTLSEWFSQWAAEGNGFNRQQIGRRKAVG